MKKKNIVIISCLANVCYAQPRQTDHIAHNSLGQSTVEAEQHLAKKPEEKKSCSFIEDALSDLDLDFDFLLDSEDEQDCSTENFEDSNAIMSRLQRFVNILGIKVVLGILYFSEICSDAQNYIQGLFREKK